MLQVNLTDETNFAELMKLLLSGEKYKLVLTKDDEPVANITFEKEMTDAEILKDFTKFEEVKNEVC